MKTIQLEITVDEANLILEGLGQMPFVKVYELIAKLQEQARSQLDGRAIESSADAPGSTPGSAPGSKDGAGVTPFISE